MSIQAVAAAIKLQGVTSTEKLLLIALANYADDNLVCFPSIRQLALDTCMSERQIQRVMHSLEGRKMVARTPRQRFDGSRSTDTIELSLGGDTMSPPPDMLSPGGVTSTTPGGDAMSPLTTFEPSPNHQNEPSPSPAATKCPRGDFNSFWSAYPRKVGKGAARRAYEKSLSKIGAPDAHDTLMAALARIKPTWTEPQFIPHPGTWLNQERWEDDAAAPAVSDTSQWPDTRWRAALANFYELHIWGSVWGPTPDQPDCRAPAKILADFSPTKTLERTAA